MESNEPQIEPQEAIDKDLVYKIEAFVCTYCTYTAADMAGSQRLQYPPTVRVVKYLCTGKVEVMHILKAFEAGADAVFVGGWEIGDCHFLEGNLRAKERVEYAKTLIDEIGLGRERLEMFHIGASDAPLFAEAVEIMTKRAKELGPNPFRLIRLSGMKRRIGNVGAPLSIVANDQTGGGINDRSKEKTLS